MLLFIEALLLLSQDHRVATEVQVFPLDMAYNSVDDQYKDCTNLMAGKVENYYLPKERSASEEFSKAWKEGEEHVTNAKDDLTKNHLIAIHVYTNKDSNVYSSFTKATRGEKEKYVEGTFGFYSLHFLVTEAIQILKKTQRGCFKTYRGTNVNLIPQSSEVRLSSFSSSTTDRAVSQSFGEKSCFEISTCEGVDVSKYSKYPEEKEVLIPPYETFRVTKVLKRFDFGDLWCETVFVLNSTGTRSDLSCVALSDGSPVTFWSILLILPVSLALMGS